MCPRSESVRSLLDPLTSCTRASALSIYVPVCTGRNRGLSEWIFPLLSFQSNQRRPPGRVLLTEGLLTTSVTAPPRTLLSIIRSWEKIKCPVPYERPCATKTHRKLRVVSRQSVDLSRRGPASLRPGFQDSKSFLLPRLCRRRQRT